MTQNISKPLITVIIPTYRRPQLLERAITSVLQQSFWDIVVYVLDNASGDETESIIQKYIEHDKRITYIRNEKNIGAVMNMKKGVSLVETPFYTLLNDDDFIFPNFYFYAMKEAIKNKTAGFICSRTLTLDLRNNTWEERNQDWKPGLYKNNPETIYKMYNSHFTQTGVILRKDIKDEIGLFEPSGDDMLYMTMASTVTDFIVIDYTGGAYTIHDQSFSATIGLRKENEFQVKEQFFECIERCLKMEAPQENKHILMQLIIKRYNSSIESFNFNTITTNTTLIRAENTITLIGEKRLFVLIYSKSPLLFRKILVKTIYLKKIIKIFSKIIKPYKTTRIIPKLVQNLLIETNTDIVKIQNNLKINISDSNPTDKIAS